MSSLAAIVQSALAGEPPSARAFETLWKDQPDVAAWLAEIGSLVRKQGANTFDGRRSVVTWLRDAARASFPADHPAVLGCEIAHLGAVPRDDGGFADAKALHARHPSPEVAALVMKGAFTIRDYAAAEEYAKVAQHRRGLAGALLHQHRWTEAFAILDDVLEERGPTFGGGGISVSTPSDDPRVSAIDEACTIATWASADVPEWVRAVGGLWETFTGDPIAAELEDRFTAGLGGLASPDDFEVVIRQSRERSQLRAARFAAKVGCERFPDDSWIHSVHGNLARDAGDAVAALASYRRSAELLDAEESEDAGVAWMNVGDAASTAGDFEAATAAFECAAALISDEEQAQLELYVARSLLRRDPPAARARSLALFQDLAEDPRQLAETDLGIAVTELVLGLLIAATDREAVAVQQRLIDAKLALWGECPSVWVERHNLGTVHAQLGEPGVARTLITGARAKLVAQFGERHPHVQLCDRSLARLAAT